MQMLCSFVGEGVQRQVCVACRSKHAQKTWQEELDYFHEVETEGKLFTDIVKAFREERGKMHIARSTLEAIIMPTDQLINTLRRTFENYDRDPTFEDYQKEVDKEAEAFENLFNKPETFEIEYQQYTVDDVLDLMENFHHIKPLAIKSGD